MEKNKRSTAFILLIFVGYCLLNFLLNGCGGKTAFPTLSALTTPELGQSPPATATMFQKPEIPTSPGKGAVFGQLDLSSVSVEMLASGRILLGGVVFDEGGRALYAYANLETSPEVSFISEEGYFYFADVPPGVYSLVYYTPNLLIPFVREDTTSSTGKSMVVLTVTADQQVDIGRVRLP